MINGTVTYEDFRAAHRLHGCSAAYRTFAIFGCSFIVGAVFTIAGVSMIGWPLMGGGVGGALSQMVMKVFAGSRKARIYRQMKLSENPVSYQWDETHLSGHSPRGNWRKPWTEYVKVKEAESFFLLYQADNLFEIVPKRWFGSEIELLEFKSRATAVRLEDG